MVKKKKKVDEWTHIRVRVSTKKLIHNLKKHWNMDSYNDVILNYIKTNVPKEIIKKYQKS